MDYRDLSKGEIRNADDLKREMTAGEAFLFINTLDDHTIIIMDFPAELIDMQGGRADGKHNA